MSIPTLTSTGSSEPRDRDMPRRINKKTDLLKFALMNSARKSSDREGAVSTLTKVKRVRNFDVLTDKKKSSEEIKEPKRVETDPCEKGIQPSVRKGKSKFKHRKIQKVVSSMKGMLDLPSTSSSSKRVFKK